MEAIGQILRVRNQRKHRRLYLAEVEEVGQGVAAIRTARWGVGSHG